MKGTYTYRDIWTCRTYTQKFVRGRLVACMPYKVWTVRTIVVPTESY